MNIHVYICLYLSIFLVLSKIRKLGLWDYIDSKTSILESNIGKGIYVINIIWRTILKFKIRSRIEHISQKTRETSVIGWMVALSKDTSTSQLLKTVNMTLSGNRVFADVIKLGNLRWDHSGPPRWTLNPMTSVPEREEKAM